MRITCETKDTLPLSALTEFQGGLKKRTADEAAKIHEQVLVFLKGNSKEANADLGEFRADNCILPEMFE